jgi:DinB superfamily
MVFDMHRPNETEYPTRYQRYIDLVPEVDILVAFHQQGVQTERLLERVTEAQANTRYAPDKWSLKEVIGHVIDVERIFSLRVLRFSRGDGQPRSDFDFDKTVYVLRGGYYASALSSLRDEFDLLRRANLVLFSRLSSEAFDERGVANGDELSVRGSLFVMLGHERHHLKMLTDVYGI